MAYEFTFLAMAVFGFIYVVVIKKQKIIVAQEKAKIAAGVCETAGQFAYIFAIGANAILAAPAISSYCVFSVLWRIPITKPTAMTNFQWLYLSVGLEPILLKRSEPLQARIAQIDNKNHILYHP